jgi:hypothetical protein
VPARFLSGDQHRQVERLDETDMADLSDRRLDDEQVVMLERSLEDGARLALRGRRCSDPDPAGEVSVSGPEAKWVRPP